jgi:hypothetical protein
LKGEKVMSNEIEDAIKLLANNGYIVKKWSNSMEEDADACANGEEMFCGDCSCHLCLAGIDM